MRSKVFAVAAVGLLISVAGCSTTTPTAVQVPPEIPTGITQAQLCDSLLAFFTGELQAIDVQAVPVNPLDAALSDGGICKIARDQKDVGRWESRSVPNDTDPTEGVTGFERRLNWDVPVWVLDERAHPEYVWSRVKLATRIEDWNARLEIRSSEVPTADGPLDLTDEQIDEAAQFLIEMTRTLIDGTR
ncbi:hypothetical protein [Nocardia puris]|uniref:hypothetical protein n=1 Tax=Nocardia puris TaxID=208602 RepID=UPI0011BE1757|nr:hypothetical protein [Nocardia puris]